MIIYTYKYRVNMRALSVGGTGSCPLNENLCCGTYIASRWRYIKVDKNHNFKSELMLFNNPKVLTASALLVAVSIVCGKLLAFNIGFILRFSFENMPIMLASMAFGSLIGGITAVAADLIGCLIVGYEINPLVTLGALVIGLISGFIFRITGKLPILVKVLVSVIPAHLVGSVLVKTVGLAKFYEIPFWNLVAWRGLNYVIIATLEILLLYYLFKSKSINSQLERIKQR